jgi:Lon protease-like protein
MYDLPLFPLETVLFPGTPVHLHIFEPRYLTMVQRCLAESRPFGVALIHQGMEVGGPARPYRVGCTAHIVAVEQLDDGRLNLTARGEERFRIHHLNHDLPYLVGLVEDWQLDGSHSLDMQRGARRLAPWVQRYLLQVAQGDPQAGLDLEELQLPEDPLTLLHWSAALLQIPPYEKQVLLEAPTAASLLETLQRLYRRETRLLDHLLGTSEEQAEKASLLN